jgi:methionyl aminopeptidase
MTTNDPKQIEILREGGQILAGVLNLVARHAKPGVSTGELNDIAEKEIKRLGATPSFKNYRAAAGDPPYPAALCTSINDEVVHGIPRRDRILKEGDIVGLDLGVWYKDLCTDSAITVPVGKISPQKQRLLNATKQALDNALAQVKAGARIGDIGHATELTAKKAGFHVVRELVGHGVGKGVHEPPEVPCYGKKGKGIVLEEGMVLAIEPMLNVGYWKVTIDDDNWTVRTYDRKPSAHFEHSIIVTQDGCEILTQA